MLEHETFIGSGECFDLRLLNSCGVFIGFPNEHFAATCHDHSTLCFTIPLQPLQELLQEHPQMTNFLRALTLSQLARFVGLRAEYAVGQTKLNMQLTLPLDSFGQLEDNDWLQGSRSRDFAALSELEARPLGCSLGSMWEWVRRSFNASVKPGIRHQSNPFSGSLAQRSVMSMNHSGLTDLRGELAATPTMTMGTSLEL